ncbi:MAG: hypothetical protein AAFW87_04530 [Pseudomonadota bacterium]
MIDKKRFDAKVEALEQNLQAKLGIRGKSLNARLARAGRLLPKRLHAEGRVLMETQTKVAHPKLATQLDETRITKAFDAFSAYLKPINPSDRRKGKILGWLGGVVFNFIVLTIILVIFLRWQGLI